MTVAFNQATQVQEVFDENDILASASQIMIENEKCVFYSALMPDEFVDNIIEEIRKKIDLRQKENTISIFAVEGQVSTHLERLKDRVSKECPPLNPFERLVEATERYQRVNKDILIMALFASLIATAGLFLNNVVIVIGGMLVSPLLGPINAFALNATLGRARKIGNIQLSIVILLGSVAGIAAVITLIFSAFFPLPITSQILLRSHTSLVDVVIGVILGLAGGLALVTAIPEILVGVSVASALLPPAAVAGIGLALMDNSLFFGALTLTLVYLVGLQLGCTIMLRIKGVQPRQFYQKNEAKKQSINFIIILSVLLILLIGIIVLV